MLSYKTIIALALASLAVQVAAWGNVAHYAVGQIAEAGLDAAALAAVQSFSENQTPGEMIATAGIWADYAEGARSTPMHFTPGTRRREDRNKCEVDLSNCPEGRCIQKWIPQTFDTLKDCTKSHEERETAYKWLIHLIADARQPFHATPWMSGGNWYNLMFTTDALKKSNAHLMWDFEMFNKVGEFTIDTPASDPGVKAFSKALMEKFAGVNIPACPGLDKEDPDIEECALEWLTKSNELACDLAKQFEAHGTVKAAYPELHDQMIDIARREVYIAGRLTANALNKVLPRCPLTVAPPRSAQPTATPVAGGRVAAAQAAITPPRSPKTSPKLPKKQQGGANKQLPKKQQGGPNKQLPKKSTANKQADSSTQAKVADDSKRGEI